MPHCTPDSAGSGSVGLLRLGWAQMSTDSVPRTGRRPFGDPIEKPGEPER